MSLELTTSRLRKLTSSLPVKKSSDTLKKSAIISIISLLGCLEPISIIDIVLLDAPSLRAKSYCEYPLCLLKSFSLSANSISIHPFLLSTPISLY